jgi:predicted RNase H-like nuclease (RuvC/YqgF family)
MKKYILGIASTLLIFACSGPTEEQHKGVGDLAAKWKNTSDEAMKLSEKIGNFQDELNGRESDTTNLTVRERPCPGLDKNYESMKSNVSGLITEWQESSQQVDRLTNQIGIGKWTDEDQAQYEKLRLEVDLKEVKIAQWNASADSLYMTCQDSVAVISGK